MRSLNPIKVVSSGAGNNLSTLLAGLKLYLSVEAAPATRERPAAEKACGFKPGLTQVSELAGVELIIQPLASETRFVRHDSQRLAQAIFDICQRSQMSPALASQEHLATKSTIITSFASR